MDCPYGYVTDSNNCPQCQCATDIVAQQLVRPNFCPGQWPCPFICPDGYETGPGGCSNCACRNGPLTQQGCGPVGCTLYCNVTGYLRTSTGCPTCQCRGQCDPPSCPGTCPVGFINTKNPNGCDVCYCASCPFLDCRLQCPNGHEYDLTTGCRFCQCRQGGGNCPQLNCDMTCLDGYQIDQNTQCPICLCNPDPSGGRCPRMECLTQCPNGQFALDTNGCQTCSCQSQCVPLLGCNLINCQAGLETDDRGCQQCQCKASNQNNPLCVPTNCVLPCAFLPNGLQKDQNNCDICVCADSQCAPLPPGCTWINCPQGLDLIPGTICPSCACTQPAGQTCVPSQCPFACPEGYRRDTNNCEVCQCQNSQCTALTDCFYANCPSGLVVDSQRCEICQCQDSQNQRCPPIRCPTSCLFGYTRDINQCETCLCQQPPSCQALSADCGFTNCPGGLVTDGSGCQTCQCRSHPDQNCQPQRCSLASQCRYGLMRSPVNSCEICTCYEPPPGCPDLPLSCNILNCPGGYVRDIQGCLQCQCSTQQGQTCFPVTCPNRCQFGYQQDVRGCLVCVCNQPGQALDCPPFSSECVCPFRETPILDSNGCKTCNCDIDRCDGIPILLNCRVKTCEQDSRGCWFCNCLMPASNQCSVPSCYKFCRTGYVLDNSGCETCECQESANDPTCTDVSGCNLICANGRKRDSNNCELCECNPVACKAIQCTQLCTFGRKQDSSGCLTCECNCLPLTCSLQCPLGLKVNQEGCYVCECRESSDTPGDFAFLPCRQSPEMLNCEDGSFCGENDEKCIECACFMSERTRGCEAMVNQCRLQCSGGYDTNQNGCEICRCRGSACPVFDCAQLCQYGYTTDSRGCPTCNCRTTPCSQITCPTNLRCPGGFELNQQGCPTCKCKETNVCAKPVCPLACPHGLLTIGPDGCSTCECRCSEQCSNSCPNDYMYDAKGCPACDSTLGCPICQCTRSPCPEFICMLSCPQGFEVDRFTGCQLCACRQAARCSPASCSSSMSCPRGLVTDALGCISEPCSCVTCPTVICPLHCVQAIDERLCDVCACPTCMSRPCELSCGPLGKINDQSGCELCQCQNLFPPSCDITVLRSCSAWCLYGYQTDPSGCPTCMCNPSNPRSNVGGTCPPLDSITCPITCPYGYQSGSNGCAMCACQNRQNNIRPMECASLNCPLYCPSGLRMDNRGCPQCVCM